MIIKKENKKGISGKKKTISILFFYLFDGPLCGLTFPDSH